MPQNLKINNMKLIECKSGNGFLELIKEVSFSIENYKKLKTTDNVVEVN